MDIQRDANGKIIDLKLYINDLTEEAKAALLELEGGQSNYDTFPIIELHDSEDYDGFLFGEDEFDEELSDTSDEEE